MTKVSFWTAFRFWLKLGFISFGGPAGQIAIMHTELVEKKKWISENRFLHALNYCMVLPGPEAQQLATYIGWLLHGTWGGIVAGSLFVIPSFFVLVVLSWIYVAYGDVSFVNAILYGIKPAVVAIVAYAVIRIGRKAIKNGVTLSVAIAAFCAMSFLKLPFPAVILSAGLLGFIGSRFWPVYFTLASDHATKADSLGSGSLIDDHSLQESHTLPTGARMASHLTLGLALWGIPLGVLMAWQSWSGTFTQMGWFFTKAALVTFGGAYAVLPYVAQNAIDYYQWLKPGQMIDGLALGETTPGPLIMVVTFVGFVGAWQATDLGLPGALLGSLVATYFTFLPSFLFILLGAPLIESFRGESKLTATLSAITAAVVGVVLNLAVFFGRHVFFLPSGLLDGVAIAIAGIAFFGLWFLRWSIIPVVLGSGLVGLAYHLIST